MNYNIDAVGGKLRVNFYEYLPATSFTPSLIVEPKRGPRRQVAATVGTIDVEVDDEIFLADQYLEYTLPENFFRYPYSANLYNYYGYYRYYDRAGWWRMKGLYPVSSTDQRVTDYIYFRVMD